MSGFLEKAFETAVVFSAIDNLTSPVTKMATSLGILDKQTKTTQATMNNFKNMAFVGAGITAVGVVMADGLIKAADAAGVLQTAIMGVKSALGLTNDEFKKAQNLSQIVGLPTIFSAQDVGGIMQTMATSGLDKSAVLNPDILRQYVNFADVQKQVKKEDQNEVTANAVKMAHQYQLYNPEQVGPFLDQLNATLLHTTESASEFATTFRYLSGQSKAMGMNSTDALSTTAWLSRMGFGQGRGGTNFADFLQRSIYHSSGKKADESMVQAGFVQNGHSVFETKTGQFVGIEKSVQIMQDFAKRFNNNANLMTPLLKNIFGTQGMRIAQMMSGAGASDQYKAVQQQIKTTPGIDSTQEQFNKTWQGQVLQFKTTLKDIQQTFGANILPQLVPVLEVINKILGAILKFEQVHPKIMAIVVAIAMIGTAVALIIGPLMTIVGVIGFLATSGILEAGIGVIGTAFATAIPFILPVIAILAAVAGVGYLIYKNWAAIKTFAVTIWGDITKWISEHWKQAVTVILLAMGPIGWMILWLVGYLRTHWDQITKDAINAWNTIKKWWGEAGQFFSKLWDEVKIAWNTGWTYIFNWFEDELNKHPIIKAIFQALGSGAHALGSFVSNGINSISNYAFGPSTPGHNAIGTQSWGGGWTWVGEHGPELMNIQQGAQILSNSESMGMLRGGGSVNVSPGAIVIQGSNLNPEQIAKAVIKELGAQARNTSLTRPTQPIMAW